MFLSFLSFLSKTIMIPECEEDARRAGVDVSTVHPRLWTSSLRRTKETAAMIKHDVRADGWVTMRPRRWRNIDELHAGIFDGMTYDEIKEVAPDEFAARKQNKLGYRYPRGESYLDVIERLIPPIHEFERLHVRGTSFIIFSVARNMYTEK